MLLWKMFPLPVSSSRAFGDAQETLIKAHASVERGILEY